MTLRNLFSVWVATAMLAAFASGAAGQQRTENDDQIVASFERELAHAADVSRQVARGDIEHDQLYKQFSIALQTPARKVNKARGRDHE